MPHVALPLDCEREGEVRSPPSGSMTGTATRPQAYRLPTLNAMWQCGRHCHSALSVPERWIHTATRPPAYQNGGFALPLDYEREGEVRSPPSGSMTGTATRPPAYQNGEFALPLGPERTDFPRLTPCGSVAGTATRPRAYQNGGFVLPLGCEREGKVRSPPTSSANLTQPCMTGNISAHPKPRTSTLRRCA